MRVSPIACPIILCRSVLKCSNRIMASPPAIAAKAVLTQAENVLSKASNVRSSARIVERVTFFMVIFDLLNCFLYPYVTVPYVVFQKQVFTPLRGVLLKGGRKDNYALI